MTRVAKRFDILKHIGTPSASALDVSHVIANRITIKTCVVICGDSTFDAALLVPFPTITAKLLQILPGSPLNA
jgi:hypothetical protein